VIAPLRHISEPTQRLSAYAAAAVLRPLPAEVSEKARLHILDTIAAMISGSRLPAGEFAIRYVEALGGAPRCCVLATSFLASPLDAALANGMLAHADETDDSHAPSRTHPGCAVIPAALAAAEIAHAGGEAFVRAVTLGYDVATRINFALDPEALALSMRSTHSFGGCFGAGAAAGALLGFDERQLRHLLSLCAQQASGVGSHVRDPGHIEKAFDFGGMPARNGVAAATLIAAGMTGVDDVFSGERNFLQAYAASADPEQLCHGLGDRFEILNTNIKKWPVGSPVQAALDSLLSLMEAEHVLAGDVDKIEVQLPGRSARTVDNAPSSNLNLQHLLAMLLVDGKLTFDSIHDQSRMQDPALLPLRSRIAVAESEELAQARPRRQAIVAIRLRNGGVLSHRTFAVRGAADNPMSAAEVETKAFDLVSSVIGSQRAQEIIDVVRRIDTVADMVDLRRVWSAPNASAG
jgi:2-methylcitrate dehydratase PrpD